MARVVNRATSIIPIIPSISKPLILTNNAIPKHTPSTFTSFAFKPRKGLDIIHSDVTITDLWFAPKFNRQQLIYFETLSLKARREFLHGFVGNVFKDDKDDGKYKRRYAKCCESMWKTGIQYPEDAPDHMVGPFISMSKYSVNKHVLNYVEEGSKRALRKLRGDWGHFQKLQHFTGSVSTYLGISCWEQLACYSRYCTRPTSWLGKPIPGCDLMVLNNDEKRITYVELKARLHKVTGRHAQALIDEMKDYDHVAYASVFDIDEHERKGSSCFESCDTWIGNEFWTKLGIEYAHVLSAYKSGLNYVDKITSDL